MCLHNIYHRARRSIHATYLVCIDGDTLKKAVAQRLFVFMQQPIFHRTGSGLIVIDIRRERRGNFLELLDFFHHVLQL